MSKAFPIPLQGLEGYYATDCGDIYSRKTGRFKKLTQFKNWAGYMRVGLFVNNKRITHSVHRLIALTFIKNPDNLPQVNHIDGNKSNNNVNNLEWCSASENQKHSCRVLGNKPNNPWVGKFGKDNPSSKSVLQLKDNVIINEFAGLTEAERRTGISHSHISQVCSGKRPLAGGYQWRYKNS